MDATVDAANECVVEVMDDDSISLGVDIKRGAEKNGESESEVRPAKRMRAGSGEMSRVAEIVLVLSAMAGMRGGKRPTEAEVGLMAEARAKLVEICQELSPKDLVGRDAIGAVIEDLGLNLKAKDQRLGFTGTRLSIKEKLSLAKMKIEESKKFSAPSVAHTSLMSQTSVGSVADSRGPSHIIRMFPSDKPNNAPLPPGNHLGSSAIANQHAGLSNHGLDRDSSTLAFPKADRAQLKSDGASSAHPVHANASGNHMLVNAQAWSMQPHSTSSTKFTPENKAPSYNSAKVEGTAELGVPRPFSQGARDQNFRPFISQTAAANMPNMHSPVQGLKYVQPSSSFTSHNEIAMIVQKLLQPKLPQHPTWTPPSREYMNKLLTCQMCKLSVNEVETVVLCDACEKGFHLKCLEAVNQKGIPRGEWYCMRCTSMSNGKPFPPKYGRVMRSVTHSKGPSNSTGSQPSSDRKLGTVDQKVQEKITANGSSSTQSHVGSGTSDRNASHGNITDGREHTDNSMTSSGQDIDQAASDRTLLNNQVKSLETVCESSSVGLSSEQYPEHKQVSEPTHHKQVSESTKQTFVVQIETQNNCDIPSTTENQPVLVESQNKPEKSDCASSVDVKKTELLVTHANPSGNSEANDGASENSGSSSNGFHDIQWIGNAFKVLDGNTYYESCSINGVSYKLNDHALFRSVHGKLIPSKLKVMWEDSKTGLKWVTVEQCYFPVDLPEGVGHPCGPESNEVYESNHEYSVVASLIQGPCKVLPSTKFKEDCERSEMETDTSTRSHPVFLCRWFFDKLKGTFKPIVG
ncbi:hypothetical protein K2173_023784 [Erythroxylum novogranatense]|uniref:PHD finger protein n=1 Tax=Erythroxylum novogranatense TaxID=1862640 RepID=A0AAV8TI11_9ROSI|nr:hypothetical protein K2173_023784 [Erythroxylum novogranatense]